MAKESTKNLKVKKTSIYWTWFIELPSFMSLCLTHCL